jgi:hypothetical protein
VTDESKTDQQKIEELELNRETVQELTESQAEEAEGGMTATWPGTVICNLTNFKTCAGAC